MFCEQPINITARYRFNNIEDAISFQNKLEMLKSLLPENLTAINCVARREIYKNSRDSRMKLIMDKMLEKQEINTGKLYRCLGKSLRSSYKTFTRDIAYLILQKKLTGTKTHIKNKGVTTKLKICKLL